MNFYNIFDMLEELERELHSNIDRMERAKEHARSNPTHVACQIVAAGADEVIDVCKDELAKLYRIRDTTKVKHAIVTHVPGGQC